MRFGSLPLGSQDAGPLAPGRAGPLKAFVAAPAEALLDELAAGAAEVVQGVRPVLSDEFLPFGYVILEMTITTQAQRQWILRQGGLSRFPRAIA